jgi:glycosyltransferase involved in cell wall biosynthesis
MHGSDVRLAATIGPARALFDRVARRAAAVTAVSRWLCAQAASMSPSLRCAVGPMPAATELFSPGPPADARRGLLFVGRLNEKKGIARLIRALARQRTPETLTVVGDGPDAAPLRALAAELGVADRLRWQPGIFPQPALADFYRAARALVVPSLDEGLGLVAVEAMLCETPVVAFASGGLPDVVDDGRTGWLVPPGDVDALAAALDAVAVAEDLAARGAAGRRMALEHFAPQVVAARYRGIYERALAGGSP